MGCPSWYAVLSWANQPAFIEGASNDQPETSASAGAEASPPSSSDETTSGPPTAPSSGNEIRGVCSGDDGWCVVCIDVVRSSVKVPLLTEDNENY